MASMTVNGSMASTRLKGFKGQAGSKRLKGRGRVSNIWMARLRPGEMLQKCNKFQGVAQMQHLVKRCCTITTHDGEIELGCCVKTTPFFCGTTVCVTAAQQDTISCAEKD